MRPILPTSLRYTILLGVIAGLPALSIDLSAPTLALLPNALETTVFVAGLTLSLFVLGFGVGQFVGGRASDRVGRRPTLLVALTIYIFAGVCCTLATSGGALATFRLVQGAGAGACSVQAYAIVQDRFAGDAARSKQSYVSLVLTVMPMLAPALGAAMIVLAGWRSVHLTMAVGGLLLVAVVALSLAETRKPPATPKSGGLGVVDSLGMLREDGFRRICTVNALSYASIFAYIAGAPVVVISQLGFSNLVYAAMFASTAAALSAGAFVSARLVQRLNSRGLVWPALLTQAAANIGLVFAALALPTLGPWPLLPLLLLGCFVRGIISPNLVHLAISSNRDQAGLAAALVGLAQLVTASASRALLARLLESYGPVSVALVMTGLSVSAVLLWVTTNLGSLVAERR
ncbi:MAG: MFS transporter [Pseudomonadota bacterium]|nr:MFS transporter [Pseudomonadota bacterium]